MAQHSGKFKLVIVKAESKLMYDPEWVVYADVEDMENEAEDKTLLPFRVADALSQAKADCAGWNAAIARLLAGSGSGLHPDRDFDFESDKPETAPTASPPVACSSCGEADRTKGEHGSGRCVARSA